VGRGDGLRHQLELLLNGSPGDKRLARHPDVVMQKEGPDEAGPHVKPAKRITSGG
jgi:hypothetical protein